jgi:biotin operon repressor
MSADDTTLDPSLAESPAAVETIFDAMDGHQSTEFRDEATERAIRAELEHPVNASPTIIAAASVYATGALVNEKHTQQTIAEAAGVSKAAIRRNYQAILEAEGYDVSTSRSGGRKTRTRSEPSLFDRLRSVISR